MSRIVVVSHRAPSTDPHKDAGGLVVAVREALDNAERAGCEEVFLVPATAELTEVERLGDLLASR